MAIRIVVILVLANASGVFGPPIEGCAAVRPMQVNRICAITMVDEANNGFCTLLHHERRTRTDAIVANKPGLLETGIDLLLEWLDVNLIVIDRTSSLAVGQDTESGLA